MKHPAECVDMQDVRKGIDALDAEIMGLIAQRVAYVDQAAKIKLGSGLPADIPSRVEDVVSKVVAHAKAAAIPEDMIEEMWRIMIKAMIAREDTVLGKAQK